MHRLAILGLALAACAPATSPAPHVEDDGAIHPPPPALVASLGLSPVYTKHLDVGGLPVLGSAQVQDAALHEAAFLIRKMIGHHPEVLRAIADVKVRFVVMATTEMTTDVPEHSDLTPKEFWDKRARGLGATIARPATSCGEENLLHLDGDPYATENILIHELSHTIHEHGMTAVDATFQARLEAAYAHARDAGLWANTYAMTSVAEYWAEAAQSWFDTNRVDDFDHGKIATREQVIAYDAEVAALLTEVYGADVWRYQRIEVRAPEDVAHLVGFDRATAPRFVWAERTTTDAPELTLLASSPGASPQTSTETSVLFTNERTEAVDVLWIDFSGNAVPYTTLRPGTMHSQGTFSGHVWLLRDAGGATLGYVVATDAPGRVVVR